MEVSPKNWWPIQWIHPMCLVEMLENQTLGRWDDWKGILLFFVGFFPVALVSLVLFSWLAWLLNPPWLEAK